MGIYFGTDGIRGKYGSSITPALAYKCGISLSNLCKTGKVLIGRDTRTSGNVLALSVANGLLSCGINVTYIDIAPTPVISYLANLLDYDFGIVISASHNPPQDNGIKIFDRNGYKISEQDEEKIEENFSFNKFESFDKLGAFEYRPSLTGFYKNYLMSKFTKKVDMKVVVDCSNGATGKLAKAIFPKVTKNVKFINTSKNGLKINENCGALHPEKLCENVVKNKADIGFAFDGDGDRIIISDEKGHVLDGDDILYLLCLHFKKEKAIVGTTMTNKGLEDALKKRHVSLLRSDVGDKYVASLMKENNLSLGGETSGHIIISDISKTGDGIACALLLIKLLSEIKIPVSKAVNYQKYPQINLNIPVQDKFRIINCETLRKKILDIQGIFADQGRVLVRASGTENKIRIMCEHKKSETAKKYSSILEEVVKSLT